MEKLKKSRLEELRLKLEELKFGSTAPTLIDQFKATGMKFNERDEFLAQFQRDADSITYLMGRGLMTFAERDQMRGKLLKKITEYLENG